MQHTIKKPDWGLFLFTWVMVFVIAFCLTQFTKMLNQFFPLRNLNEIISYVLINNIYGTSLGIILGLGQWFVLKWKYQTTIRWWLITIIGYTMAFFIGSFLPILIMWIIFGWEFQLFLPGSQAFLITPHLFQILLTGLLIALFQWPEIKKLTAHANTKKYLLWIFGSMAGWGISFFIIEWMLNFVSNTIFISSIFGLLIGAGSWCLLILILYEKNIYIGKMVG
jgi:hypothetical protein